MYLSTHESETLAAPMADLRQIPADFILDAETFDRVLDFEAGLRMAFSAPQVPGAPTVCDLEDGWKRLVGHLPENVETHLQTCMSAMLDAFNARDTDAVRNEQEHLARRLAELRKSGF